MSGLDLARQGRLSERGSGADIFIDHPPPGVPAHQSLNRRTLFALKDEDFGETDNPIKQEEEGEEGEDEEGEGEAGEEEEEDEAEDESEEGNDVNVLRAQNQTLEREKATLAEEKLTWRAQMEALEAEKGALRMEKETLRLQKEALEAELAEHARTYKCLIKKAVRRARAQVPRPAAEALGVREGRVVRRRGAAAVTAASSRPRRANANY